MRIKDFLKMVQYPEKGFIDKKIFKKALYANAGLSRKQAEVIKSEVQDIRWCYTLKPETVNIPAFKNDEYEYTEIQVISVTLKSDNKKDAVATIIQRSVPYPVLLFLEYEDNVSVSVASKRISKIDVSKSVIDEEYITNNIFSDEGNAFVESLQVEGLSFKNLYELYEDVIDRVKLFLVCEYRQEFIYENKKVTGKLFTAYQKIKELEESKRQLQRQIKKETDFAKKVKLNVEIKKIEENIIKVKGNINVSK